jgi:hypothetical protein
MRATWVLAAMLTTGPALAQGFGPPGQGGGLGGLLGGQGGGHSPATLSALQGVFGPQTPEQKRAFCTRVAGAARNCGLTLDMTALGACLIRGLPPEDSARVARVANTARGNPTALLGECGIGF